MKWAHFPQTTFHRVTEPHLTLQNISQPYTFQSSSYRGGEVKFHVYPLNSHTNPSQWIRRKRKRQKDHEHAARTKDWCARWSERGGHVIVGGQQADAK